MRTNNQMIILQVVMCVTEFFGEKRPKNYTNSVYHHLFFNWLVATRPLLCDTAKTAREAKLISGYATHLDTSTREEIIGWEMLMNSRPKNTVIEAAFPTFIRWGRTLLG